MNTNDDILAIIVGLAGTVGGVFVLLLGVLGILTPLLIYLIHRSTKRTARATEEIVRQNEKLIDRLSSESDFSFGPPDPSPQRRDGSP